MTKSNFLGQTALEPYVKDLAPIASIYEKSTALQNKMRQFKDMPSPVPDEIANFFTFVEVLAITRRRPGGNIPTVAQLQEEAAAANEDHSRKVCRS
jgi:hypothetical protein